MSLLDRLSGVQEPKLPVHQFWAAVDEYADGALTETDLKNVFGLTGGDDLSEWNFLRDKYISSVNKQVFRAKIHVFFILAEHRLFGYDTKSVMQARISSLQ